MVQNSQGWTNRVDIRIWIVGDLCIQPTSNYVGNSAVKRNSKSRMLHNRTDFFSIFWSQKLILRPALHAHFACRSIPLSNIIVWQNPGRIYRLDLLSRGCVYWARISLVILARFVRAVCVCVCVFVYVYVCACAFVNEFKLRLSRRTYVHTNVYMYMLMYICTCLCI